MKILTGTRHLAYVLRGNMVHSTPAESLRRLERYTGGLAYDDLYVYVVEHKEVPQNGKSPQKQNR